MHPAISYQLAQARMADRAGTDRARLSLAGVTRKATG
jgi:hypothetical protein